MKMFDICVNKKFWTIGKNRIYDKNKKQYEVRLSE